MKSTFETRAIAQGVLDYIHEHPEKHNQSNWFSTNESAESLPNEDNFCKTTMCVAGTALFLTGGISGLVDIWEDPASNFSEPAAELLGLDAEEADRLFYTMNNEKALDMLNAVANGDEEKFHHIFATHKGD